MGWCWDRYVCRTFFDMRNSCSDLYTQGAKRLVRQFGLREERLVEDANIYYLFTKPHCPSGLFDRIGPRWCKRSLDTATNRART